jgi:ATPase subunit of ABC transporter with duplicated ATPase domains
VSKPGLRGRYQDQDGIDAEGVHQAFPPQTVGASEVEALGAPRLRSGKRRGERAKSSSATSRRVQRGRPIGIVGATGRQDHSAEAADRRAGARRGQVTLAKTLNGIVIDQQRKLMSPRKKVRDVLAEGGDWIDVRGTKKHIKGYLKEFLFSPS